MNYFVTTTYLKDNTSVGDSVDDKISVPSIKSASDSYVRTIIGNEFYKYLLNAFNNQTLTNDEIELVSEYIKPSIAWRAAGDITIASSYQIKNKGLQVQNGDFSNSPEYKAIMFNFHHISDKASLYDSLLINFLIKDKTKFPQFWADNNKDAKARKQCEGFNTFNKNMFFI